MKKDSKITLRQRLRDLNIKIIDLAKMLNISRPTLYKLIESYEANNLANIDSEYIALFNYIIQNEFINSNNVLVYIAQNILALKEGGLKNIVSDTQKENFINILLHSKRFDCIISYLISCHELLEKEHLSEESIAFLEPLKKLYNSLGLKLI